MTYQYLQQHSILRVTMCLFIACLCCFGFFAPPIVTAHALAIEMAMIIAIAGTVLTALGIGFAYTGELQRGATTFYNACKAGATQVSNFIEEQAAMMAENTAYVMTIPIMIMNAARLQAWKTFPPKATAAEDSSGIIGKNEAWRNFLQDEYRTLNRYGYRNFPITVVLNKHPAYSPYGSLATTPISPEKFSSSGLGFSYLSDTNVFRVISQSGKTYDYRLYTSLTANGVCVELAENGIYVGGKAYSFDGYLKGVSLALGYYSFQNSTGFPVEGTITYLDTSDIEHSAPVKFNVPLATDNDIGVHVSNQSKFGGIVDSKTGIVDTPLVTYNPNLALAGNTAWSDAMAKEKERDPTFVGPSLTVPADLDTLVNQDWEDMLVNQQELTAALRDAIAALEDVGAGTGEGTISGTVEIAIGDVALPSLSAPTGIVSLFPFCIPFDIARGLEALQVPPVEPYFEIPLQYGNIMDETIVLDLSWLDFIVRFIRWAELFLYGLGLAVVTRNYIKW